jgi:spore germination cell wall hydrolase CwlJ-like protein
MTELLMFLTLTAFFESRGEPEHCQVKVAQVVLNRMGADKNIASVVLAPAQFSWVPEKMSGGILKEEFRPNKESAGWLQAERAAKTAIYSKGTYPATHFHATWIQKPASWSKLNLLTTCGQHHFYS